MSAKLISAQFVKPFVQGNKNNLNDARAICEAAPRPSVRVGRASKRPTAIKRLPAVLALRHDRPTRLVEVLDRLRAHFKYQLARIVWAILAKETHHQSDKTAPAAWRLPTDLPDLAPLVLRV